MNRAAEPTGTIDKALSHARRLSGDGAAALAVLERLTAGQPNWAAAHHELGLALIETQQRDSGLVALRRAPFPLPRPAFSRRRSPRISVSPPGSDWRSRTVPRRMWMPLPAPSCL